MTLKAIMSEKNDCTKPGQAALQNMKLLQKESAVFKVPILPKKKKTRSKTEVLDEDVYVQGIAKIIQRDFFPDLEKLKAQNEFLEATENKDYAKLREITRKYSSSRPPTEPYNSPATFDTPNIDGSFTPSAPTVREDRLQADIEVEPKDKSKDATDSHTLDSFLARYTSEDNASYDRVIALEEKKRVAKLTDQLEAEVTSAARAQAALELPSMEQQADQSERPLELESWKFTARNYIMYVPSGASQPPTAKPLLVHKNTRLQADPFDHNKVKETITANARTQDASISGKIGVDGVSVTTVGSGDAQYPLLATPSPRPGVDHSPLMTWGEIEGTPFRLDGGDTPLPTVGAGAAYRMLEGGTRERLALQLAEKAARSRRAGATTPARTPSPYTFRTNTERLASMSPAAKKLAAKHLWSPRTKLTPNNVGILPTGSPRRRRIPTSRRTPLVATPGSSNKVATLTPADAPIDNITDNLLQINVAKRQRMTAQDFFQ